MTTPSGLPQPPAMAADRATTLQRAREFFAQPVLASFVAGGVAGAVSRTVVSPLERLKILFQVQSVGRNEYKMSVPKALAKMWREEGWRGFMAGNGTNCIRIVPYSAVQFSAYGVYKRVSSPSLQLPRVPRLIWAATRSHVYVLVSACHHPCSVA
jgi:solute carrier family 25 phosphate transporter 23/24/25/41